MFGLGRVETDLTHLGLDAVRTAKIRLALTDLAMHATRWFLNHGGADDIAGTIETYRPGVATLVEKLSERLLGDSADAWQEKVDEVTELGLDRSDAAVVAAYDWSPVLLSIVEISEEGHPLDEVADAYLTLARRVDMIRLTRLVEQLPQGSSDGCQSAGEFARRFVASDVGRDPTRRCDWNRQCSGRRWSYCEVDSGQIRI